MTSMIEVPVEPYRLLRGGHPKGSGEFCANEMTAWLAGEEGYMPACCSPIVNGLRMALNDRLPDDKRQLLRPFALRSLGTATDGREEERRQMCNEYLLHTSLPMWLKLAGQDEIAERLSALPADLSVEAVQKAVYEARDATFDARKTARGNLKKRILEELGKHGYEPDAAVAAATVAATADVAADVAATADVTAAATAAVASVYGALRKAVKEKIEAKVNELLQPGRDDRLAAAIDLLDRMLPPEPLMAPVIPLDDARVICAAPEALAA